MEKMMSKAILRNLRVAPRKVRLLVDLVRGKQTTEALMQLQVSKRHAALPLKKLIESAIANAKHNHNLVEESLVIKEAFVDGGVVMKRFQPRAFGRAGMIRKRTSQVTLVLEGEVGTSTKKAEKKSEVAHEHDHDHDHTEEAATEKKSKKTAVKKEKKSVSKKEKKA